MLCYAMHLSCVASYNAPHFPENKTNIRACCGESIRRQIGDGNGGAALVLVKSVENTHLMAVSLKSW